MNNLYIDRQAIRFVIFGLLFGLLSDFFAINYLGAWEYNNIPLQVVAWIFILFVIYDIGSRSEGVYGRFRVYAGLVGLLFEILLIYIGHVTYIYQPPSIIPIGNNFLPLAATWGWPMTTMLLLGVNINLYNWLHSKAQPKPMLLGTLTIFGVTISIYGAQRKPIFISILTSIFLAFVLTSLYILVPI